MASNTQIKTHFEVGKRVHQTMVNKPEDLLTPNKSVKQLESEKKEKTKKNTVKNLDS